MAAPATPDPLQARVDKLEAQVGAFRADIARLSAPSVAPIAGSPIPQGWAWQMPPTAPGDRDKIRAEFQAAAGHDKFALIFPDAKGSPAGVVAPEAMQATLMATLGDSVKAELIAAAREAAGTVASEAVAAHLGARPPEAGPFGGTQ